MKQLAIIGSTASGKSDLAIVLAKQNNAYILSIDSLSIYKEIDIASAKPSADELREIKHFGINTIYPDEKFDVTNFIDYYHEALRCAMQDGKNLIIVGGTSFYLKTLITGLSTIPTLSAQTIESAKEMMNNHQDAHKLLLDVDYARASKIEPQDRYRIEKMLLLYLETNMAPSRWFELHPPKPIIEDLSVLDIEIDRDYLRQKIALRSKKMIEAGLLDEVKYLQSRYGRDHNSMRAIGIIEVLEYFDNLHTFDEMVELISTHTAQLAKRQRTFNKNQFTNRIFGSADFLYDVANRLLA